MSKPADTVSGLRGFLERLPDYLVLAGVALLLADEFFRATFSVQLLSSATYDVRVSLAISVVAVFVFSLMRRLDVLQKSLGSTKRFLGVVEILPAHQYIDFRELVLRCRLVRLLSLSGTKAGFLGDSRVIEALADVSRRSKVIILIANPRSNTIIERYKRDEPDTYEAGVEGIERRILALYGISSELPEAQKGDLLNIRVFDNYPTISIIQGDEDIYSTTYGYKLRGGDCPKVHCKMGGDYARFLIRHFEMIYRDALPIDDWISKYRPDFLEGGNIE